MTPWARILAAASVAAALLLGAWSHAAAQDDLLRGKTLGDALRAGGYVLIFRHAATEWSNRDEGPLRLEDCSTQRNLSEAGRADSVAIGQAARALGIKVSTVSASPFCRTRETAELAFGKTELSRELMWPGSGATAAVREAHRAKVSALLGMMPAAGTIGVLVTHGFVIHGVTELHVAEGEAIVVRPGGDGKFTVVARLLPADWSALAGGP